MPKERKKWIGQVLPRTNGNYRQISARHFWIPNVVTLNKGGNALNCQSH